MTSALILCLIKFYFTSPCILIQLFRNTYIYNAKSIMENKPAPQNASFYEKLYRSLVSIVLILLLLFWSQHILIPITFAALFALLLITPASYLEKKTSMSRGVSSLFVTILFIASGFIIFYLISSQFIRFRDEIPKLIELFLAGIHKLETWVTQKFNIRTSSIDEFIRNATTKTLSNSTTIIGSTLGTLSGTLVYLVLIPIFIFLLLYYRGLILLFFIKIFKEKYTDIVQEVLMKIRYVTKSYIIGLFIEMLIVAVMNCIGFFILGVKYALLLGVIAAVLNVIPYLGIFTACIFSLLITSTTNTPGVVAGVAIVLIIVHLIDSNIILPKVVGSKVKINVMATLFAVLFGNLLWGIPGMFLSIPVVAILKIVFDSVENLQPWGLLIGEESRPAKQKVSRKWKNFFFNAKKK